MILAQAATSPWAAPNAAEFGLALIRLALAAGFGAALGLSREVQRKPAGLRTHMLVALGACLAPLIGTHTNLSTSDTAHIIGGVITGIGFLGAGTIIKASTENEVHGLTTAASVWVTAIIGVTASVAPLWLAGTATALAWVILVPIAVVECRVNQKTRKP